MKREFIIPKLNIRRFTAELTCVDSNVTQAVNALTTGGYSISREKVSVATLEKK